MRDFGLGDFEAALSHARRNRLPSRLSLTPAPAAHRARAIRTLPTPPRSLIMKNTVFQLAPALAVLALAAPAAAAATDIGDPAAIPAQTVAAAPETYTPNDEEKAAWQKLIAKGVDKIAFVRRLTYSSNHYYTEYVNARWTPGGGLSVLDLKTGAVTDLVPSFADGVFGAFDVSFDAKKIVFAYRESSRKGYRLFEVNTDGTGLRQVTFPEKDEVALVNAYKIAGYHHGTDDMDPCYLPDGAIAFVSTRCQHGTLCDGPDIFTTTNLYRVDTDGKNLRKLTTSALSEHAPSLLPDGRILYTRWEYVDKGAVSVKCLWAVNPDGSNSVEIYGNDVAFPPTFMFGRGIPGSAHEFVFTGTPHYPQNCVGTVIRIDTTKDIRTREPMTYITPQTDIRGEGGFSFRNANGGWQNDGGGRGPLFREAYPLSRSEFLVSHKRQGPHWNEATSYYIYLLEEGGKTERVYKPSSISAFRPIPLVARKTPPIIVEKRDEVLAAKGLAECIVTDVYKGMAGVEPGSVKYLRVLEQVPRPWAARRRWGGDEYDQQHAVVSKDAALGLKIQRGIVRVEADGSARFLVPAERAIFLQALDGNFRALQTERTYVNYMPGEVRSCVGCHESTAQAPSASGAVTPLAMKRKAEMPFAQPGDSEAARTISYARDVQPVWDKHCVSCHGGTNPKGNLSLLGTQTALFSVSYEQLVPERRRGRRDRGLIGPIIGENHPKTGNVHYMPAKSFGSYASVLVGMLTPDIKLSGAQGTRAASLAKTHQ
ncbi:MAG: hypothetical protein LBT53_07235, partial [Puniceicoccales bacterium]|nr:hypothetical protein [Puniceicoccales bacterium]